MIVHTLPQAATGALASSHVSNDLRINHGIGAVAAKKIVLAAVVIVLANTKKNGAMK